MFKIILASLFIFGVAFFLIGKLIKVLSPEAREEVVVSRTVISYLFLLPLIGLFVFSLIYKHAKPLSAVYTKKTVDLISYSIEDVNSTKYYNLFYLDNEDHKNITIKDPSIHYIKIPQKEKASFMLCTQPSEELFVEDHNGDIQLKGFKKQCKTPVYAGVLYLQQPSDHTKD